MADEPGVTQDLQQIRNILFGEQASQIEERFDGLDRAINALRRETRALRQALEAEATARTEADRAQLQRLIKERDEAYRELTTTWLEHLRRDQGQRAAQWQRLAATLEAHRQSQDETTAQLIALWQAEQQRRREQFAALQAVLEGVHQQQDQVTAALQAALTTFRSRHITAAPAGENGEGEGQPLT